MSYYPKNYNANGYGWHNPLALQSGMGGPPDNMGSQSTTDSGVSGLYPPFGGMHLSYGFVVPPPAQPSPSDPSDYMPIIGFIDDSQKNAGLKRMGWKRGDTLTGAGLEEPEITAVKVTDAEVMAHGLFIGAGQSILNQAGEAVTGAVKGFIDDKINEFMCVKKDAEIKRQLPSLKNMKILGERGSGTRARSQVQDFNTIQQQCLSSGTLFEDPDFPAEDSSLMFSRRPDRRTEWLRPMEMVEDPKFFVEGYSRFDVQQGELGDCWLLAATANLTMDGKIFGRVVPDDQSFEENYAGIFHFRFWQYGRWVDVCIDDRLPTYRGKLLYMHSTEQNEFWSALLEKAYAKLHGSYEALKGGTTCEAMEDFTGGVTEMYELKDAPKSLFSILMKGYERNSMIACSIEPEPGVLEAETPQGLIKGHAYSVTKVEMMDIVTPNQQGKIQMVRLRNPWGNEAEWNGAWSDKSPEWRYIPEHVKESIGLTFDHDGEFWMSLRDFITHFDRVEICNLSPDSLSEEQISKGKKKWEMSVFEGEWTPGVTAGGCRNFLDTFWHNPQYVITLDDPDEDDDEGLCTVIIALMQKNRRSRRNVGMDCLTIGFAIYSVTDRDLANKPQKKHFFQYNASVARSPAFINLREVSCRFKLPPGHYLIVPSTFDPNEEGEFLIRVFSECKNHMEENDEEVGVGEVDDRTRGDLPNVPNVPNGMGWQGQRINGGDAGPGRPEYRPHDPEREALERLFIEVAGADGEVDWMELKSILDRSMRDLFPQLAQSAGMQQQVYATNVAQVNAPGQPGGNQQTDPGGDIIGSLLNSLCGLICGLVGGNRENDNQGGGGAYGSGGGGGGGGPRPPPQVDIPTSNDRFSGGGRGNGYNNYDQTQPLNEQIQAAAPYGGPAMNEHMLDYSGFSKDVCRSMVAMLDTDQSGKLGFEEFRTLLTDVKKWRDVFKLYDHDNSGKLSAFELRTALNSAGYHLNNRVLNSLAHRYGSRDGMITFDDFIMCAIKMKTMIEIFKERDIEGTNMATFSMDEWVEKTVYS